MGFTDSGIEDICQAIIEGDVDFALDVIIDNAADLDQEDVNSIMSAARHIDPTESGPAAAVRDTLRDNNINDLDI